MAWPYEQSTGRLLRNGVLVNAALKGYSGKIPYKDDPAAQHLPFLGPIPRGRWHIGGYTNSKGPYTITLTPEPGTQTFGRTNFRIHGDSMSNPGTASEGCIVLGPNYRVMITQSGDTDLKVVQ